MKDASYTNYNNRIHRWGRISTIIALITIYFPVFGICLYYDVQMDWAAAGSGIISVLAAFAINQIVEPLTFAPMLGSGGTYIGFITGSVSQTKVPSVVSCQEIMGVEMGTEEGDIIATLATGTCSLITTLEMILGLIFVNAIYPVLSSPILAPGFNNVVAAIMAAVLVTCIMKDWKVAIAPLIAGAAITFIFGQGFYNANALYIMLALIAVAVGWAYFLYKTGRTK